MSQKMLFEQNLLIKTQATGMEIKSKVTLKSLKE